MGSPDRANRRFRGGLAFPALAAGICLAFAGCMGTDGAARNWLDPLRLTTNQGEPVEQPEFRKKVAKDPFPSASQVGLAVPARPEKLEAE
jgi:hypothetical protein